MLPFCLFGQRNARIETGELRTHTPRETMTKVPDDSNERDFEQLLRVRTKAVSDAVIVEASGEIDMLTAPGLEHQLQQAVACSPRRLVLDLTDVTFLASAGLALLVRACRDCGDATDLRVIAATSATQRPIELTGLVDDLRIHHDRAEALNT